MTFLLSCSNLPQRVLVQVNNKEVSRNAISGQAVWLASISKDSAFTFADNLKRSQALPFTCSYFLISFF